MPGGHADDRKALQWCGTVPADSVSVEDLQRRLAQFCIHWVFQRERAQTGYEHYQLYCKFRQKQRLAAVKAKLHATAHWESARGSIRQNWDYCTKTSTRVEGPWSSGSCPQDEGQGKSSRRAEAVAFIQDGGTWEQVVEDYADVLATSYSNLERLYQDVFWSKPIEEDPFGNDQLCPWMLELLAGIEVPDRRSVNWVVDLEGGKGKTRFVKYLKFKFGDDVYICRGGKMADIAYEYGGQSIVLFDLPREKQDFFQYSLLEAFKDGFLTSTKYHVKTKWFEVPFVCVMANWAPDFGKLSQDRWNIIQI